MKKKIQDVIQQEFKGLWGTDFSDDGIPVIKTNNMTYEGHIDFSDICKRNINIEEASPNFLQKGDLIIEKSGGTKTHSVGYVNIFEGEDDKYVCNNFILPLRPNKELVNSKYLFWQLHGMYESGKFSDCYNKTTGIQNLQKKTYFAKEINVPSKDEQQKIAAELDTIQSAIDNKKQQLSLLDEAVKSEFVEMFGEIDISPQRNGWTELKDITTIYTGTTPSTTDEENWNGDILWITPAEMTSESFYIYDTERKITEKGQKSKSLSLMPVNTVLLSTRAPIGKVGIAGSPMTCNQGFKNFYCKEDVLNPVYLYFLFKSNTEYLNSKGTGTTFKELSKSVAEKIKVPIPDFELQNRFAAFVQQIDKSKFIVKQQIADLQELLDNKMQVYFGE